MSFTTAYYDAGFGKRKSSMDKDYIRGTTDAEFLRAIASKFSHMPDEDITILEREVAEILVNAGHLKMESLEYAKGCFVDEYILTSPTE